MKPLKYRQQCIFNLLCCLLFVELRKLAAVLVDGWMATIRSQSVSGSATSPAGTDLLFFLASKYPVGIRFKDFLYVFYR